MPWGSRARGRELIADKTSRKGTQYTHHYGQNSAEGSLTPYIHMLFKPEIIE